MSLAITLSEPNILPRRKILKEVVNAGICCLVEEDYVCPYCYEVVGNDMDTLNEHTITCGRNKNEDDRKYDEHRMHEDNREYE